MTRTARKENSKPINVAICDTKPSIFEQYQQELQGIGYHLNITPKQANKTKTLLGSDICIVAAAELELCQVFFQNTSLPFLIYDVDQSPAHASELDIFYDAVGYFVGQPSAESIGLTIQLGLQRHKERENYANRMRDITDKIENNRINGIATGLLMSRTGMSAERIFDEIKSISRNRQQRVSDVSSEIIDVLSNNELKTPEMKMVRQKPIRNLSLWLEGTVLAKAKNR